MNHQRALQLTLDHGREIFGKEFPRQRAQGLRWLARAARQGCALSGRLLRPLPDHLPLAGPAWQPASSI